MPRRRTADTRIFSPYPPRRIPHRTENKKPRRYCQGICGVGRVRLCRRTADTRIFSPFPPRRIPHQISNKKPRHFCQGICGVGRSASSENRRHKDFQSFSATADTASNLKQKTPAFLPGNLWCGAVRLVGEPPTQGFSVLFRHGGYRINLKTKNPGVSARESVVWGGPPRRRTADTRIFSPFPPRRIPHQS